MEAKAPPILLYHETVTSLPVVQSCYRVHLGPGVPPLRHSSAETPLDATRPKLHPRKEKGPSVVKIVQVLNLNLSHEHNAANRQDLSWSLLVREPADAWPHPFFHSCCGLWTHIEDTRTLAFPPNLICRYQSSSVYTILHSTAAPSCVHVERMVGYLTHSVVHTSSTQACYRSGFPEQQHLLHKRNGRLRCKN